MIQITLSEIYRLFKSKSKILTLFIMVLLIVLLSLLVFNNMEAEGGNAVLRFMNNAVGITEAKLSEFIRLIFESGIFTFFTGISFIVFKARLYNTKNIQNIIVESKSRHDIILSSFITAFLFILWEFILIFFSLMLINTLFGFDNNWYNTFLYLLKQFLCQYAYLMIMDVLIDFTQSNLVAIIFHFILSSGLFYTMVAMISEKIGVTELYTYCLSYNFLMLSNIETSIIVILPICYLLLVAILKYVRYFKMGEFK